MIGNESGPVPQAGPRDVVQAAVIGLCFGFGEPAHGTRIERQNPVEVYRVQMPLQAASEPMQRVFPQSRVFGRADVSAHQRLS